MTYETYTGGVNNSETYVRRHNGDGTSTCFAADEANTDYQAYLKWLDEGNTPLPADV